MYSMSRTRKYHVYKRRICLLSKCTCHVFKERIKIIDVFVLYDSTTPKLQKIRLTTVTNNYYLYCTTFVMRLTFESLKIMAMIGFGILLIMILSIIIIFN